MTSSTRFSLPMPNSQDGTAPPPEQADFLPAGKLAPSLLQELLTLLPTRSPQLLLGPGIGEDAAVIEIGGEHLLVAKSDPITFATDEIGYYAVHVCANDLAVTGARPLFYLPTLLLPAGQSDRSLVQSIFSQLGRACRDLGIVVAGGHTEITDGVKQPVVAGTMLGQVDRERVIATGGCQTDDKLLLVGSIPIEGTSIIAREKRSNLLEAGWSAEELGDAAAYLTDPGISVLEAALSAAQSGLVTAMHDPTEGGIVGGLREMALAAGVGMEVYLDRIPISSLSARLCAVFDLDPLGTIASGALLATAAANDVESLLDIWREQGLQAQEIGRVVNANDGVYALRAGQQVSLPTFYVDEITKLWSQ